MRPTGTSDPCEVSSIAKAIHSMIRALDERRSVAFRGKAFGLQVAGRLAFAGLGLSPTPVRNLDHGGQVLATFFFRQDPDGYRIELLQHCGRYRERTRPRPAAGAKAAPPC